MNELVIRELERECRPVGSVASGRRRWRLILPGVVHPGEVAQAAVGPERLRRIGQVLLPRVQEIERVPELVDVRSKLRALARSVRALDRVVEDRAALALKG